MKNTKGFNSIFRTEVFVLIGVVSLLVFLYGYFFLNFHVKRIIEKTAFESIGSEVNIDSVKIDFFAPSVTIKKIQVTNPDKPEENVIEIGTVLTSFSYGPLLQGSFISEITNVLKIEFHTERNRPGRILPPEQRILVLKDPSQNKVQDTLKAKFKKTAFSDLVSLFSKDKRKEVEEKYKKSLESLKLSGEVEAQVGAVKARLKKTEDYLESARVKNLLKEVKDFRFDSSSTEKSLKSASIALKLSKKLRKERDKIKADVKFIEKESQAVKKKLQDSPSKFLADVDGIGGALSPTNLSSEKITEDVLSEYFAVQLEQVGRATNSLKNDALGSHGKYVDLESKPSPTKKVKKTKGEEDYSQINLEKQKEEAYKKIGREFVFYKNAVPPKYWLKKINIISKAHEGQDFGDIKGFIQDFTDAPQITQKEMIVKIVGSVPKQGIGTFKIDANINHINEKDKQEKITIDVSDYLVKGAELFKGSDEWLKILESNSKTLLDVTLKGETLELELSQSMRSPKYEAFAKDKYVLDLLNKIKAQKTDLTFKLSAVGDISDPKVRIKSNLGDIILKAVQSSLSSAVSDFAKSQISKLDGAALEKMQPYLKDIDVTNLKATDLSKVLDKEIEKGLKKLKSGNKDKQKDLLKKLFKKF